MKVQRCSVDLHVASVVSYLPSSENNEAGFVGMTSTRGPGFSDASYQKGFELEKQNKTQEEDARKRAVLWDAENVAFSRLSNEDTDLDFVNDSGVDFQNPIGQRDANGSIIPLKHQDVMDVDMDVQAEFRGKAEIPPSRVGKMVICDILISSTACRLIYPQSPAIAPSARKHRSDSTA